jgi:hypothetical protein
MASEVGSTEWRERKSVNTTSRTNIRSVFSMHKYLIDTRKNWIIKDWPAMCVRSHKVEAEGASHAVYISHARVVAALIEDAANWI